MLLPIKYYNKFIQKIQAYYRIAGNFQGVYISRIDIKFIFVVTNFADGNY